MATVTKTAGTVLFAPQELASNSVLISSEVNVASKFAATFFIKIGRTSASALTAGVQCRIEGAPTASGDTTWHSLMEVTSYAGAAEAEPLVNTEPAGSTVIQVSSTTNLSVGNIITFRNSTPSETEWARIISVAGGISITLQEGLLFEQDSGSSLYTGADIFPPIFVDCSALSRLRLVINASQTGQIIALAASVITADSIG